MNSEGKSVYLDNYQFMLVALVISTLVPLAAFMTVHSERKINNETGPEKDHKSRVTAGGSAKLFALDISKGERKTRQPAFLVARLKSNST